MSKIFVSTNLLILRESKMSVANYMPRQLVFCYAAILTLFNPINSYSDTHMMTSDVLFSNLSEAKKDDDISIWTLDDLIKYGVNDNPRVVSSMNKLSAAGYVQSAAWQEYLPTPSMQMQQDPEGKEETSLSLNQPLWSGGRIESGIDEAAAQESSAVANVAITQYDLALSIINSYQLFVQSQARLEALTKFSERLKFYRERMDKRVAYGASPANDSELLDARIATNEAQLRVAQENENVALTQLSQMTGINLKRENLSINTNYSQALPLQEILIRAEQYNPKIQSISFSINAAEAVVKRQRSVVLPDVSLVLRHTMVHGSNLNGSNGDDTSVSLQVSMTPGAGLSSFSRIKAAQSEVYALRESKNAALQELLVQIRSDYEKFNSSTSRYLDAMQNSKAAAGVLSSYERLFVAGKRGWMDVMNAARDLSDANIIVADTNAEKLGARYRLDVYSAKYVFFNKK